MKRIVAAAGLALALSACNDGYSRKALSPIPPATMALMSEKGMAKDDPILVRLYKKESELEVWKRVDGQYAHLKTFPICRWSGQLGPKTKEGDRQAPEGFYTITPAQLNPNSSFYLSFDTGYPNAFDRAHGRTGSHLMVHGDCSSRGCYAMTDEGIGEVYALAREALGAGQRGFQVQAYPFRMTAENFARFRHDPNMPFWKNLKQGSDHFEVTKREPKVAVCGGRYAFDTVGQGCTPDPTLSPAVAQKDEDDRRQIAEIVGKGTPAVRLVYADGGGHESFRKALPPVVTDSGSQFALLDARPTRSLGQVSRPDALAEGPREVAMEAPAKPAPARGSAVLAAAASRADRSVAVAPPQAPAAEVAAAPAPPAADRPFYDRMVNRMFGREPTAEAPAAAMATEPPPATAALPPRRAAPAKAAAVSPAAAPSASPAPARPKPQASVAAPTRHADAGFAAGAAAVGPTATTFTVR